ncbi:MAG: HTH domain-containing protein, partial [Clostridia bacterium]
MLKRKILSVLEKACGNELSGQKMAEMFGVSRNAVWKSINQLKNEGYEITSSIKKGYALLNSNNIISAESIFA